MSKVLMHYGVKGQKWGVRRYQNRDGSLTDLGKRIRQAEKHKSADRINNEQYKDLKNIKVSDKNLMVSELSDVLQEKGIKWFNKETDYNWTLSYLQEIEGMALVDKGRNALAGYIIVDTNDKKYKNLITPLEIMPKYRRQGLGTKLLSEANNKYGSTTLSVWMDNKPAVRLYRKNGYVKVSDNFNSDGSGWYLMRKGG